MSDRAKVLTVEDDHRVRALLRNLLEDEGFEVLEATRAREALEIVKREALSLVTLDIQLGADNGVELLREIRTVSTVPVIMVTGRDDVIDRVVGLEIGADDYITKPFHVREVIARLRAVLRRHHLSSQDGASPPKRIDPDAGPVMFDGVTVFPDRMEALCRDGRACGLTTADFRLLQVFLERPKRVLSRDQLMDLTGGGSWSPLDRTIDNQVARLRKKIERDPASPKLIKTVRGIGYTFTSDVDRQPPSEAAPKSA